MQLFSDCFSSWAFTTPFGSNCLHMAENVDADKLCGEETTRSELGSIFPRFSDQNVDDQYLERVMSVTRLAPSEWNLQTWRWIAVRSDAAKNFLETTTFVKAPLNSAPVILICVADTLAWKSAPQRVRDRVGAGELTEVEGREVLRRMREYYASSPDTARHSALANAFLAVNQALVSAADCNLTAYSLTELDEAKIKTYFHVPDNFVVAALLPIGYSGQLRPKAISKIQSHTPIYKEKFGGLSGS
jgi:nitroreductase